MVRWGATVDDALTESIAKARAAGISVISSNIDDSRGGAGTERQAFVGQDFSPPATLSATG